MATSPRVIGRGPIQLGLVTLPPTVASWAKYSIDFSPKLAEVNNATAASKDTLHANVGWTGSIEMELPVIGRDVAALSVGSWTGAIFEDFSLSAECDIHEGTGGADTWKQFTVANYGWSVDAKKWEATDSLAVFLALLMTQGTTPFAEVAFSSFWGAGDVLIEKAAMERGVSAVSSESLTCKGKGDLTSSDPDITLLTDAVAQSLTDGYSDALGFVCPEGTGLCHIKSVKLAVPAHDKATKTIELQGTDLWELPGA